MQLAIINYCVSAAKKLQRHSVYQESFLGVTVRMYLLVLMVILYELSKTVSIFWSRRRRRRYVPPPPPPPPPTTSTSTTTTSTTTTTTTIPPTTSTIEEIKTTNFDNNSNVTSVSSAYRPCCACQLNETSGNNITAEPSSQSIANNGRLINNISFSFTNSTSCCSCPTNGYQSQLGVATMIVPSIGLIILVAAVVALCFYIRRRKNDKKSTPDQNMGGEGMGTVVTDTEGYYYADMVAKTVESPKYEEEIKMSNKSRYYKNVPTCSLYENDLDEDLPLHLHRRKTNKNEYMSRMDVGTSHAMQNNEVNIYEEMDK